MHEYSELPINADGMGDGLTAASIQSIADFKVMGDEMKFRRLMDVADYFKSVPQGDDEFRLVLSHKRIPDFSPLDYMWEYTQLRKEEMALKSKLDGLNDRLKNYV